MSKLTLFSIIFIFFIIGTNASIFQTHLSIDEKELQKNIIVMDLNNYDSFSIKNYYIEFKTFDSENPYFYIKNEQSISLHKLPTNKDEIIYTLITSDNLSINLKIIGLTNFVKNNQNISSKNNKDSSNIKYKVEDKLYDLDYLNNNNYIDKNGKIPVIIKFSENEIKNGLDYYESIQAKDTSRNIKIVKNKKENRLEVESLLKNKVFNEDKTKIISELESIKKDIKIKNNNIFNNKTNNMVSSKTWIKKNLVQYYGVSSELTIEEIHNLKYSKNIEKIVLDKKVNMLMSDVPSIINSDLVNLEIDNKGNYLTG